MIPTRKTRLDVFPSPSTDDAPSFQPVDAASLANVLGLELFALWFFVLNAHTLYTCHNIPKKSGGMRTLHVPDDRLAHAQRRVLTTFLNTIEYPAHVSAYVQGRSVLDAGLQHAGRPILIVVDLKDFFPSTRRTWVRDALQEYLALPDLTSELLATLVCAPQTVGVKERFRVPQGAPTSGAVANLVAMQRLDPLILAVCAAYGGVTYTRYADDLAFSREAPMDRDEASLFIKEILAAIKESGYRTNYKKIRVLRPHKQQRLLGMTLNVAPNLPKQTYRKLRAMVHSCATQGYATTASRNGFKNEFALSHYLNGWLAYAEGLAPARIAALRAQLPTPPHY